MGCPPARLPPSLEAGFRFEPGGQGIPHARHEGPDRRLDDHLRVHQDQVRVHAPRLEADAGIVLVVPDGERAGRRIVGGNGGDGHDLEASLGGRGLGGVERFAAADADSDICPLFAGNPGHPGRLRLAGLPAKIDGYDLQAGLFQAGQDGWAHSGLDPGIPQ